MLKSRRKFLWGIAIAAQVLGVGLRPASGQNSKSPIPPFKPDGADGEDPPPTTPLKTRLESNDKDIKKKVQKLFQLASELKDQVEKTDSSQVLSLALLKKAEEIEKLAKEIKNRSAG
ncbi:MAG: hypothetical protein PVS2B2_05090 [Candidatus Acidiferrum sp.]